MHYHKCHRCKLIRRETTKSYHKRISISFSLPFICAACMRLHACVKHPDFTPHVVPPKVKKAKKSKLKSIDHLNLPPNVMECYQKFGRLSPVLLQRKLKLCYHEAKKISDEIDSIVGYKPDA